MSRRPQQGPPQTGASHPLLAQAVALHHSVRASDAAKIYEQVLAQAPRQCDATYLPGMIALQEGRFEQAQPLISSALESNPTDAGTLSEAVRALERCLTEVITKACSE
jgi:hypothetical protein